MLETFRPRIQILSKEFVEKIIDEAFDILKTDGVQFEYDAALKILADHGEKVDFETQYVCFTQDTIDNAIESTPKSFELFDVTGKPSLTIGSGNVCYDPGSAALKILDVETNLMRPCVTDDYIKLTKLVEQLDNIKAQSTSMICSDVPTEISDSYRLYIAMLHGSKPIVTGIFQMESLNTMIGMVKTIRGGSKQLKSKPLAIFDACPSSPLRWSDLTSHSIIECAKASIPSELIAVPLTGATGPMTLSGMLVQHTVENLSGLILAQLVNPGTPIIYGGAPTLMDMKIGSTPFGSIETTMIDCAYAEIARYFGLPTHAYLGLSDSKTLDLQAGYESYQGILFAALAGINIVSGVGILDYITCQSLEKLVIDNELCGMAYRLLDGIAHRDEPMAKDIILESRDAGHFLAHPTTMQWLKPEQYFPSKVVDRTSSKPVDEPSPNEPDYERAKERVDELLKQEGFALPADLAKELRTIMESEGKRWGMDRLPV